ncbi:MAG: alanine racemase [Oscillospiraceae bacterium]|nr:alanine racemase [Oscillospiraceae bacterium]
MNVLLIEKQKVRNNLKKARQRAKGAAIYGVLKGDAYGLGLVETARFLRDEGITRFAVGHPYEGAVLREAGFGNEEILMLRSTAEPHEVEEILDAHLVASVGSRDAAIVLSGLAERRGTVAEAQIKIDTGLGRYGFLPDEFDKIQSVYQYISNLAICGVYTHINAHAGAGAARAQVEAFRALLNRMQSLGMDPGIVHAAGSGALFRFDLPRMDAVRIGQAMTGRLPGKKNGLQPVGTVVCPVSEIRWLPKGHKIGTSERYTCRKPTRIALLPVGLSDGIRVGRLKRGRFLSFRLFRGKTDTVRIGDSRARILGNVGLTHTAVDCTSISCAIGDTACIEADPLYCARLVKRFV